MKRLSEFESWLGTQQYNGYYIKANWSSTLYCEQKNGSIGTVDCNTMQEILLAL